MDAIEILRKHKKELAKKYPVRKIGVFGSHARGEAGRKSDVDVLVEFAKTVDIFEFIDLKEYLEGLFGREVDLVTKGALKPLIKDLILSQVIYV
jgi:predicted nucleotidyltransferase